ncbi:MAG TPA: beta-galactosidase trimerization domain-containing protein [Armatimonadota bacterium]|jgi:hypothetical protein
MSVREPRRAGVRVSALAVLFAGVAFASTAVSARAAAAEAWRLPDPLYKELLGTGGMGLSTQGLVVWPHYMVDRYMTPISREYGFRYSAKEVLNLYASRHWNPLYDPGNMVKVAPLFRQCGVKGFWYPITPDRITTADGKSFYLPDDPACRKASLDSIREYMPALADVTWGVYTADELELVTQTNACQLFWNYQKDYPRIRIVDREIKARFGFGKYGIPLSSSDTNPYRWRAFNAWVAEQMVTFQSDVYHTVKALNPRLKVISIDPTALLTYPQDRTRWRCDIMTNQTYAGGASDRCRGGWAVKMLVDLSGAREVWPCMHIENYPACFDGDAVLEELSQAVRNGASGWHFYPCDVDGNLSDHSFFADEPGARERWNTVAAITEQARSMKRPIFPKPDFAILYSADTYGSQPGLLGQSTEHEFAYTQLGATPRAWFKFIDDLGISRNQVQLSQYKAVFVPLGKYERLDAAKALVDYAKRGGALVSGDPEIFSNSIDGSDISSLRAKCFGVKLGARRTASYVKCGSARLPVYGKAFNVSITKDARALAVYPDGRPAIVLGRYGRGQTVYFAFNPFSPKAISEPNWKAFFKTLEKRFGIAVDQKIWRFQFPRSLVAHVPEPAGRCLTNNYGFWRENKPLTDRNADTGGSYTLSLDGDLTPDKAPSSPFTSGKLTDRLRAWKIGTVTGVSHPVGSADDYTVQYASTSPLSIAFDFARPYPLASARVFYGGQLPSLDVYVSDDNLNWTKVGAANGSSAGDGETLDIAASGKWGAHRYLRLDIPARMAGQKLLLSEVEVWAERA